MYKQEQRKHKDTTKRPPKGCTTAFVSVMLVLAILWGVGLATFRWLLDRADTTIEAVETFRPKVGSKVFSADGMLLGEFASEVRQLVPLNEIPLHLQKAFVITEDHGFYQHKGVRPLSIISALRDALRTGHMRGASTITQQLVRNVEVTGIGQEVTLKRKAEEALAAFQLERRFTKDEILELYLNQIPLGGMACGVEAASWQYFGKSCRDLTLGESAVLAGLTRSPTMNRPDLHPDNAWARRDIVLKQMLHRGTITQEEHDAALAESMDKSAAAWAKAREAVQEQRAGWKPNQFIAPYFARYMEGIIEREGWSQDEELREEGLTIVATVDMRLQTAAEEALRTGLDAFDKRKREELKRSGKEEAFVPVSGALVCIDNRAGCQGHVRALVGDRDFPTQQFCNATQALRQAGSTIKPYIWASALDNGYTPSSTELDTPFIRVGWEPKNYGGGFTYGPMTLRNGLERSVNMVAIRVLQDVTVPSARSYMQRFGITTEVDEGLALALGTCGVSVLDQCVAYSTFAKGGIYTPPAFVREIRDRDGFMRYKAESKPKRALPENVAYVLTYLLEGVVENGTGTATRALGRPRAGKTGTTNDCRDAWFCGYTPDYTCVVWVGYRDNRPLGHGAAFTGGGLAAPIWTDFMRKAHEGRPVTDFRVPPDVEFLQVDKSSGRLGGFFREAFVKGTRPPEIAPSSNLDAPLVSY